MPLQIGWPPRDTISVGAYEWRVGRLDAAFIGAHADSLLADIEPYSVWRPATRRHDGLKLLVVLPDSVMAWGGFHSGDVVRSINGTPTNSVNDVKRFFGRESAPIFRVKIERNGRNLTLVFYMPAGD